MINKENVIRRKSKEKKINLNIKVSKNTSKWLKENNYSPTKIFVEACKHLGWEE